MKNLIIIFSVIFFSILNNTYSQIKISGTVINKFDNDAISNVNIISSDKKFSAITNEEGLFEIIIEKCHLQ